MQNCKKIAISVLAFTALTSAVQASYAVNTLKLPASQFESHALPISSSERAEGAKNFIKGVAKRGIDFLSNGDLTEAQRKKEFRNLLVTSFDIKTIGRFALGRYWRTANPKQQKEYLGLFEDMIVDVYSRRFDEYKGQDVHVIDVLEKTETDIIVNSEVVPDSGPKFHVDWRVRYKNGQYRIIDIMVEGVSMALTHRSDFSAVIQRGGGKVDVLLEHLRK